MLWDLFLIKKLLKSVICTVHSWQSQQLQAKKKKKKKGGKRGEET